MNPNNGKDPFQELEKNPLLRLFANLMNLSLLAFTFAFTAIFTFIPIYAFKEVLGPSLMCHWNDPALADCKSPMEILVGSLFFIPFIAAGVFLFFHFIGELNRFLNPPSVEELTRRRLLRKRRHLKSQKKVASHSHVKSKKENQQIKWSAYEKKINDDLSVEYTSSNYFRVSAILIGLFALFWNGIISMPLMDIINGKGLSYIFLVFLIPFILVGLALIASTIYLFYLSFLPNFRIRLSPGEPELGQNMTCNWSFERPTQAIKNISIWIEATLTETEEHDGEIKKTTVVYRNFLVERTDPRSSENNLSFTLPKQLDIQSSYEDVEVRWNIRVRGEGIAKFGYHLLFPIDVQDSLQNINILTK